MRGLASLLLVLVVVTHYAYEPLAGLYEHPRYAAQAIFYALRGLEGAVLFCIVWTLAPRRPIGPRLGIATACAWGALEEAQTAVCMVGKGLGGKASAPAYTGLCDAVTGWPVYMLTVLAVLLIFSLAYTKEPRP